MAVAADGEFAEGCVVMARASIDVVMSPARTPSRSMPMLVQLVIWPMTLAPGDALPVMVPSPQSR